MAHAVFHLSVGLFVGTALTVPLLGRAWRRREPLAPVLGAVLVCAYGAGGFAVLPRLIGRLLRLPPHLLTARWLDVFLFYRWWNTRPHTGLVVGGALFVAWWALVYGLLITAIVRQRRRGSYVRKASS